MTITCRSWVMKSPYFVVFFFPQCDLQNLFFFPLSNSPNLDLLCPNHNHSSRRSSHHKTDRNHLPTISQASTHHHGCQAFQSLLTPLLLHIVLLICGRHPIGRNSPSQVAFLPHPQASSNLRDPDWVHPKWWRLSAASTGSSSTLVSTLCSVYRFNVQNVMLLLY